MPYTSISLGVGFCARSSFSALNCSTWAILGEGTDVTEYWQIPWQSQGRMGQSQTDFQTICRLWEQMPRNENCFCPGMLPLFSWDRIPKGSAGRFGGALGNLLSYISCKIPYAEGKRFNLVYVSFSLTSAEQQAVLITQRFP